MVAAPEDAARIDVWDYHGKRIVSALKTSCPQLCTMWSDRGEYILSCGHNESVHVFDARQFNSLLEIRAGVSDAPGSRAWTIAVDDERGLLGVGTDNGYTVVKYAEAGTRVSVDLAGRNIKVVTCRGEALSTASIVDPSGDATDVVETSSYRHESLCGFHPTLIEHSANKKLVVAMTKGRYSIFSATVLRSKAFGEGIDFCWGPSSSVFDSGVDKIGGPIYAKLLTGEIQICEFGKEGEKLRWSVGIEYDVDGICGCGQLSPFFTALNSEFVVLYMWRKGVMVGKFDLPSVVGVNCSESGSRVAMWTETGTLYMLNVAYDKVVAAVREGNVGPTGVTGDACFNVASISEAGCLNGSWYGDVFIYATAAKVQFVVEGEVGTVAVLPCRCTYLGYSSVKSAVFVADCRDVNGYPSLYRYSLPVEELDVLTYFVRGEHDRALELVQGLDRASRTSLARHVERLGNAGVALEMTGDNDHKFQLAVESKRIEVLIDLLQQDDKSGSGNSSSRRAKWAEVSKLAMASGQWDLLKESLTRSQDWANLLLVALVMGDKDALNLIATDASVAKNVQLYAQFVLGKVDDCVDTLIASWRAPEAALFARSYAPSKIGEAVSHWKKQLPGGVLQERLASPDDAPHLFPDLEAKITAEMKWRETIHSAGPVDVQAVQGGDDDNQLMDAVPVYDADATPADDVVPVVEDENDVGQDVVSETLGEEEAVDSVDELEHSTPAPADDVNDVNDVNDVYNVVESSAPDVPLDDDGDDLGDDDDVLPDEDEAEPTPQVRDEGEPQPVAQADAVSDDMEDDDMEDLIGDDGTGAVAQESLVADEAALEPSHAPPAENEGAADQEIADAGGDGWSDDDEDW